jgi:superfamily II DNA/RNA helicase
MNNYFQRLFRQLGDQGVRASVSGLQIANAPLRRFVTEHLSQPIGQPGSLLGDPVFEATFPWEVVQKSMGELAGEMLNPGLVQALDNPPKELVDEYRFPLDRQPYKHQVMAWEILGSEKKRSIVVTSGTGSGKTECFLIPILNDLVTEYLVTERQPLEGVRALFLYPLNALINSQKDRLSAWTDAFGTGVRYCLYNGLTPERPPRNVVQMPNVVESRQQLRSSPPPILVTNATMLEYMLVRTQDQPILEKSRGKLRWIVLDEAHTYLGSQAAELSLLLRRVMHAFCVEPPQVRFVATSATIGDDSANVQLQEFLAQMAGISPEQVSVVSGARQVPPLSKATRGLTRMSLKEVSAIEPDSVASEQRYLALSGREDLVRLRRALTDRISSRPVKTLAEIQRVLFGDSPSPKQTFERALKVLDLCSSTGRSLTDGSVDYFLPLRAHLFGRTVGGIWACVNQDCSQKSVTLQDAAWGFGQVYFTRRDKCKCGAPVLDLVTCNECNTAHLMGRVNRNGYIRAISEPDEIDDFARQLDPPDEEDSPEFSTEQPIPEEERILISANSSHLTLPDTLNGMGQRGVLGPQPSFSVNLYQPNYGDGMCCPSCETKERRQGSLFMRKILGAPFHLATTLPSLLEFSPAKIDGFDHPSGGRRMITFTDSRQGTARIAANLQMDSERNFLRSQVYHTLLAEQGGGDTSEMKEAKKNLADVEKYLADNKLDPGIRKFMEKQRDGLIRGLEAHGADATISWEDMASKLATNSKQLSQWILSHYREFDSVEFDGPRGARSLAELLLAREFLRRPTRQNSLESMGMVQVFYPSLEDRVKKVPAMASLIGFELTDWKDFLKLLLDWHVRANQAVSHQLFWRRWIGNRFPFRQLASPKQYEAIRGVVRWPAVRGGQDFNRFVRLLREVYRVDPSTTKGKDQIDTVFQEAWHTLQLEARVLKPIEESRFHLDLATEVSFRLQEKGWICPITRRHLDTTLKGVTPFLPPGAKGNSVVCEQVEIPRPVAAFAEIAQSRAWLSGDRDVAKLRNSGVWTNLHDRVVENARYFSAAEHSAQQASGKLRLLEKLFKKGNLNVLSCSTTMEMGVDIGGISVVAMNNVPPNPANYLQRAGRAGRRGEPQAISYTLCKDDPHGYQVLANTRWPFDTAIPLPKVSLQSAAIVQRHVNSLLLSEYLIEATASDDVNLLRLNCEWFYLAERLEDTPCRRMLNWCEYGDARERLAGPLEQLVKQSVLEGRSTVQLFRETAQHLSRVEKRWRRDYEGYEQQLELLGQPANQTDTTRAIKAVEIGMHRLRMEYLLGELATQGFLPGYGFPTGVVSFNTITAEQLAQEERQRTSEKDQGYLSHREDNRQWSRNFPSRSRSTGIREYAPGADVVIDGLVYHSSGISLSWQRPMTETQAKEPQGFFHAWECKRCGAAGTSVSWELAKHCDHCGREVKDSDIQLCMQPSGFSVDIGWKTHNDITRPHYLPVTSPKINADGEWIPLVQERLGRFRTATAGQVLHTNSGSAGSGYAICLECGRAADMLHGGELPEIFKVPHKRLRGGKVEGSNECPASHDSWLIKPGVHLAHRDITDVFELQLKHVDTQSFLQDASIATTLAVSLRHAAALKLGINQEELGYSIKHVEIAGGQTWSILLFDTADGGAGYASSLGRHIVDVATKMYERLDCAAACDKACHHCLLTFETQHQASLLDRSVAKDWLTPDFCNLLALPLSMQILGPTSSQEMLPLYQAIETALQKVDIKGVRIYFAGDPTNWDTAMGDLRQRLTSWISRGLAVEIVIDKRSFDSLDDELLIHLAVLSQGMGITLSTIDRDDQPSNGTLVVEVIAAGVTRWACEDTAVTEAGPQWGTVQQMPLIMAIAQNDNVPRSILDLSSLVSAQSSSSDVEIELDTELDGKGARFGERFWDLVLERHETFVALLDKDELSRIQYSDRYLKSPLTVALLLQVLKALDTRFPNSYGRTTAEIRVEVIGGNNWRQPNAVWNDWNDARQRERAIEAAFEYVDLPVRVGTYARAHMPHSRMLELEFASGQSARIRLDEGWGYWETLSGYESRFDFTAGSQQQGERIAMWSGPLQRRQKRSIGR